MIVDILARTGVCIQCDAGMCKSFFHVSCAHAAGFLSEPIYTVDHAVVGEPQSDAYLAHCKLHSDKSVVKKRRRAFLTHLLSSRKRKDDIIQRRKGRLVMHSTCKAYLYYFNIFKLRPE